ncbi:MAG: SH3 domain-containing protein [Bacteroidales bacterium]|jgi:hypothetical protein|nr:SH3 domain-containing protein [Bacteroidales bacterium]
MEKLELKIMIISIICGIAAVIMCHAHVYDNGKLDSIRLKKCMDAVNEINSSQLTKAYLLWSIDKNWTLQANNNKENVSTLFLDEFSIYKDAQGNIRKIIYTNYEYGYEVLICYYNPEGQLIRAVFNIKDDIESFWGNQFADKGELFFSNIAYIKYDASYVEEEALTLEKEIRGPSISIEYEYEGKLFRFGDSSLDKFTHVNHFKSYYNIDSFPSGSATVTFSYDVNSGKTIVGSNQVRIRDAAHLKSNIVATLYAGDDITILEQSKRENISPWGEFYWYKVKYQNFYAEDHTGYIFGAFLEPVEQVIK